MTATPKLDKWSEARQRREAERDQQARALIDLSISEVARGAEPDNLKGVTFNELEAALERLGIGWEKWDEEVAAMARYINMEATHKDRVRRYKAALAEYQEALDDSSQDADDRRAKEREARINRFNRANDEQAAIRNELVQYANLCTQFGRSPAKDKDLVELGIVQRPNP